MGSTCAAEQQGRRRVSCEGRAAARSAGRVQTVLLTKEGSGALALFQEPQMQLSVAQRAGMRTGREQEIQTRAICEAGPILERIKTYRTAAPVCSDTGRVE